MKLDILYRVVNLPKHVTLAFNVTVLFIIYCCEFGKFNTLVINKKMQCKKSALAQVPVGKNAKILCSYKLHHYLKDKIEYSFRRLYQSIN